MLISIHVERNKKFATDLTAGDVVLLEDGHEREFPLFEGGTSRTLPLDVLLLFDTGKQVALNYSLTATDAALFQASLLDKLPAARLAVYGYENVLMPFCGPTRNPRELSKALSTMSKFMKESLPGRTPARPRLSPPPPGSITIHDWQWFGRTDGKRGGGSAIYEAIVAAARAEAAWPGDATRALVVFGRGSRGSTVAQAADTERRLGKRIDPMMQPEEALPILRQLGIHLYPVRIYEFFYQILARRTMSESGERNVRVFLDMGEATGGLAFEPEQITATVMEEILTGVAEHLRSEYVVAFRPAPSDGKPVTHHLEVRLRPGQKGVVTGGVRDVVY